MTRDKHDNIREFTKTLHRFEIVNVFDDDYNISHEPGHAVRLYIDLLHYWEKRCKHQQAVKKK